MRGQGYREKADIFSLGSVFFNILTGCYLFNAALPGKLIQLNHQCNLAPIYAYLNKCSPKCRELLLLMVSPDPSVRPTAKEALNHSWFKEEMIAIQDMLELNRQMSKNVLDPLVLLKAIR